MQFVSRPELSFLKQWLTSSLRKPLILRGARQVGKTSLVREFSKRQQKQLVELNFEQNPELKQLFTSNNPEKILSNIELNLDLSINKDNCLLFLDEIQAAPEILSKLRWFYEQCPELAIIAAGSLLEFTLASFSFSMPVGRIEYLYLEPLSFEDYLKAIGKEKLIEYLREYEMTSSIPDWLHEKLSKLSQEFSLIGGMPSAVNAWVTSQSFTTVQQVHQNLLGTYRDDFNKYAGRLDLNRLTETLSSIPRQLASKFTYRQVNKDASSNSIKQALLLLTQAKICHLVQATHGNGIPLGAELIDKSFKVIMLDVGLASTLSGLSQQRLVDVFDLTLIHQGSIAEQYVGQLLRTLSPYYVDPTLYYWIRDHKGSSAEVDYLYAYNDIVIPIEVKSGSTGRLRSLHEFMKRKKRSLAVRINADKPSITEVTIKTENAASVNYHLLSLPFYLLQQLPRLLTTIL